MTKPPHPLLGVPFATGAAALGTVVRCKGAVCRGSIRAVTSARVRVRIPGTRRFRVELVHFTLGARPYVVRRGRGALLSVRLDRRVLARLRGRRLLVLVTVGSHGGVARRYLWLVVPKHRVRSHGG